MSNPLNFRFGGAKRLVDEVTAQRLNAMLDEIRRAKPLPGKGVSVRQESHGVRIDALGKGGGGGGAAQKRQPWDIYVAAKQEGTYTLRVQPGTLARVLASNYNDTFSANNTALYYGIARVTTDGTYITGVSLDITTSAPSQQEATRFGLPAEIDILFGLFKSGESLNLAGQANIEARGVNVIVTTPDPVPEPGEPMFDLYFKLQ
jgi:hypothetical protein